ncbi:amino acid adenylation domain-containing protein [Rhodococcoides yunnanense]|uniref:Amino acid adenylation domain-containing protein n=1 Tax=Rhodococcoides yunnanense TaxID=278209 RepID=A0ABU4BI92_9NOCA|nr:amino acid adenylation domain-containing protein [Rhodococcus yunnanensis]MDV6263911.1 amino acid adenylation domain-containing protein [Rhodococcus yunnanensis]
MTDTRWHDQAIAAAAVYQARMTLTDDVTLDVDGEPVRIRIDPAAPFTAVIGARAPLDDAPPLSARVRFGAHNLTDGVVFAFGDWPAVDAGEHTERLRCFTERLLANPDIPVGDVDLLTPAEADTLAHEWNATEHNVPALTLPELVEANTAKHPDRLAIKHHSVRLTYAELNTRANRIARLLLDGGAGPGDVVAMVLPRSIDYIATALAVIKTGAAYLPVDTSYPVERITQVLSDSAAAQIVTNVEQAEAVLTGMDRLVLDEASTVARLADADPSDLSDADRRSPLTPETPAYVLYTSGSTGRPKGVVIAHRAITNRLHHMQHQIPLGPEDRLLQKTPAGFDVTVREVFWPLLAGASIVVADPDGHRDPTYIVETVVAEDITITHFVPSGLKVFLAEPGAARCTSLRRVVCGGEALPAELQAWFASVLPADLFNVYGPTEAAVDVTSMLCPRDPEPGPVLIGRPVWNTKLYVLDERRQQLPAGVIGELYLAGVQLAEGYLGRPELTAEKFVEDPYGGPGARMYRSGDAARWREDGVIEFFGRLDHQVKIRGFRVELEEIESVLLRDDQVGQAVCLLREDNPGDQRLVAYVVPAAGATPDVDRLRTQAAAALPDYMVPSALVVLDALPLTSNEKLDRNALPKPQITVVPAGRAPSTPEERLVAGLFTELLEAHGIGVEQDFFALGGNSLLAAQLVNGIYEHGGNRLKIRQVLENPTVQGLAALLAQ